MPRFTSKRIVLLAVFALTVVSAGILYYHFFLIAEDEKYLATDFTITVSADNGAFLCFITPDGKEKIEVSEGQFGI